MGAVFSGAAEVPGDPDRCTRALCGVLIDGHFACSGFFVAEDGTCLTCAHAVLGTKKLELLLPDGRRVPATRRGAHEAVDTAVLRARLQPAEKVPFLTLAQAAPPVGRTIFLAGSPLYRHRLLLSGSVAGRGSTFEYLPELKTYVQIFHVSAMTPRGTSGGPWLNERGEVVGLQCGGIATGANLWGVAFAVPVRCFRPLVAKPDARHAAGDLGAAVEELWEHPASTVARFSPVTSEGLLLSRVLKGGASHAAGLAGGHLIVAVEDRPCRFRDDLLRLVRRKRPGDTLRLEVLKKRENGLFREEVVIRLGSSAEAHGLPGT